MPERRKYPRFEILVDIILKPLSKKKARNSPIYCVSFNISQGGLGIVSIKSLSFKYDYVVKIKNSSFTLSGFLISEDIVRSKPKMKKYGFQFHAPLKLLDLESLLRQVGFKKNFEPMNVDGQPKVCNDLYLAEFEHSG